MRFTLMPLLAFVTYFGIAIATIAHPPDRFADLFTVVRVTLCATSFVAAFHFRGRIQSDCFTFGTFALLLSMFSGCPEFVAIWLYEKAGDSALLEVLATDGVLRSQFETRTSNGALTAFVGGDRWRWESRIFSGAYDLESPSRRPKYGALNYRRRSVGGSPRFGSSHFRLAAHVLHRTTFCYPDSFFEPQHFGNASHMGLMEACDSSNCDELDRYIEAHVHGPLCLSQDVEALVLDPCYIGTQVEEDALKLPVCIEWHPGFRISVATARQFPEYRGQRFVELAATIAVDGWITPAIIGTAVASEQYSHDDLKKVWHYVARFATIE